MELFSKIRRILRGGKALPNEHGPLFIKRDDMGKWIAEIPTEPVATLDIKIVPATTSDKADCVCGHGTCKCAENKKAYAEAVAEKQKKASATKPAEKKPVAKAPVKKAPATKKPKA